MKTNNNRNNEKKSPMFFLTIIIIMLVIIFTFGCTQGSGSSSYGKSSGKGLVMETDTVNELMYDSDFVVMEVLLENKGAYTVPSGSAMIKLGGYDPGLFNFPNNGMVRLGKLEGQTSVSTGFSDYVSLGQSKLKDGFLGESLPEVSPTFIINVCYPYRTSVSGEVCINPDIYGKNPKVGECRPGSAKVYNTEAPISAKSIQERFLSYDSGSGLLKVKFDISISNIGKGKIWTTSNEDYMYDCGKYHSNVREIQNKVKIVSASLSGVTLDCTSANGDNVISLVGNSATFSCIGEVMANEAYTTQLQLELEYGNSNYISKKVTIKSYKYSN